MRRCLRRLTTAAAAAAAEHAPSPTSSPPEFEWGASAAFPGAPCMWGISPPHGWRITPTTALTTEELPPVTRVVHCKDLAPFYKFIGRVLAMAAELELTPLVEWHAHVLTLTVPQSEKGLKLAQFVNDEEYSLFRITITGGTGQYIRVGSASGWLTSDLIDRVYRRVNEDFCWGFTTDMNMNIAAAQEVFLQWYNRADFLLHRMTKQKREFRPDLSISKLHEENEQRRRRLTRRKAREEKDRLVEDKAEGYNIAFDVLPREVRESMEADSGKMQVDMMKAMRSGTAAKIDPSYRRSLG